MYGVFSTCIPFSAGRRNKKLFGNSSRINTEGEFDIMIYKYYFKN